LVVLFMLLITEISSLYTLLPIKFLFLKFKSFLFGLFLERVMGIEPTQSAWEADILPLNYTRLLIRNKKNYTTKTLNSLVVIP
jgi:hypothetical protein